MKKQHQNNSVKKDFQHKDWTTEQDWWQNQEIQNRMFKTLQRDQQFKHKIVQTTKRNGFSNKIKVAQQQASFPNLLKPKHQKPEEQTSNARQTTSKNSNHNSQNKQWEWKHKKNKLIDKQDDHKKSVDKPFSGQKQQDQTN